MPSPGFHAHAAAVMRSLLFVPADDGKKLDKAMTSGADAVIVDLEDSIPAQGKTDARMRAAAFITDAVKAAQRPRLLVRINGFTTGLADADLDAVVPARSFWRVRRSRACPTVRSRSWRSRRRPRPRCFSPARMAARAPGSRN